MAEIRKLKINKRRRLTTEEAKVIAAKCVEAIENREPYEKFRDRVYGYILAYRNEKIEPKGCGMYNGKENPYVLPEELWDIDVPAMLYSPIKETVIEIQNSEFRYKPHLFAYKHIASSQTACVNLFVPVLESPYANDILKRISCCPSDFHHLDRGYLYHGYRFEFWDSTDENAKGLLGDHSKQAGTDADIAIAYRNNNGDLCLWLIEHKLTEKKFTECGGYKSTANKHKEVCMRCDLADIMTNPSLCMYHGQKHYNYWNIMEDSGIDFYGGRYCGDGCPFRGGMNQLWRNQLLAMALEKEGIYKDVYFSVVHHPENHYLKKSINTYHLLTSNSPKFSSFKSSELIDAASVDSNLIDWVVWYKNVYYGF